MITAEGDRGQTVQPAEDHAHRHGGKQPDQTKARIVRDGRADEGADPQLALETDVDDPGALGEHPGHGRENQDGREAQRRLRE